MKGIMFKEELFKKVLSGVKTQTRRVIKSPTGFFDVCFRGDGQFDCIKQVVKTPTGFYRNEREIKPRYKVGDILYLKEPYLQYFKNGKQFGPTQYRYDTEDRHTKKFWKSKMFMPQSAARYFIRILNVRIERLSDISNEDAYKEGCVYYDDRSTWEEDPGGTVVLADTPRDEFQSLWNSINSKPQKVTYKVEIGNAIEYRSFPWCEAGRDVRNKIYGIPHTCLANPWVWVYDFELQNGSL